VSPKQKKSQIIQWTKAYWNKALKQLKPNDREVLVECFTFRKFDIKLTYEKTDDKNDEVYNLELNPKLKAKPDKCLFKSKKELDKIEKLANKELQNADFYLKILVEAGVWPKDLTLKGRDLYKDFGYYTGDFGFIYFIRNEDIYKIGITTDLLRRMQQLKPDEIISTIKCANYMTLERELHKEFKANRIPQSEYFRFTPREVQQVNYKINHKAILN